MPTGFRIDVEHGIVFAKTCGETSSEELLQSLSELLEHPDYVPNMRLLLDMQEVLPSLSRSDVLKIGDFVRRRGADIGALRLAVVVPKDASFGMAQEQKVELDGSTVEMEVFRGESDARGWLGLSPEGEAADSEVPVGG